jgi:hypothetical protein
MHLAIFFIFGYLVGFVLNIAILKHFGKKIGIDCDDPKGHGYDDWESNAQAYFYFSIIWPLFIIAMISAGIYKITIDIIEKYLKSKF